MERSPSELPSVAVIAMLVLSLAHPSEVRASDFGDFSVPFTIASIFAIGSPIGAGGLAFINAFRHGPSGLSRPSRWGLFLGTFIAATLVGWLCGALLAFIGWLMTFH